VCIWLFIYKVILLLYSSRRRESTVKECGSARCDERWLQGVGVRRKEKMDRQEDEQAGTYRMRSDAREGVREMFGKSDGKVKGEYFNDH
jgi:hypothetical protein